LAAKVAFKEFSLQVGIYPSGKECKGSPQPNVMLESATPAADGWLSSSISK